MKSLSVVAGHVLGLSRGEELCEDGATHVVDDVRGIRYQRIDLRRGRTCFSSLASRRPAALPAAARTTNLAASGEPAAACLRLSVKNAGAPRLKKRGPNRSRAARVISTHSRTDSVLESAQDSVRPGHVEPDRQQRFVQR